MEKRNFFETHQLARGQFKSIGGLLVYTEMSVACMSAFVELSAENLPDC